MTLQMTSSPATPIRIPPALKTELQAIADARGVSLARLLLESTIQQAERPELLELLRDPGGDQRSEKAITARKTPEKRRKR
jgi:hypothetical protein